VAREAQRVEAERWPGGKEEEAARQSRRQPSPRQWLLPIGILALPYLVYKALNVLADWADPAGVPPGVSSGLNVVKLVVAAAVCVAAFYWGTQAPAQKQPRREQELRD
jgi:hypothetical protein